MGKKQNHSDSTVTEEDRFLLRLYIAGMTPRSVRAIENVKAICTVHLHGRYRLQVIDIYKQPKLAKGDQIIAVPTLLKRLPAPLRTLIGDLSNIERVLIGLDLRPVNTGGSISITAVAPA